MGKSYPDAKGVRVAALHPDDPVPDPGPMLYSADALDTAEILRGWFGRELKKQALEIAKREGRRMVTRDDMWSAFDRIDIRDTGLDPDEGLGDGK